MKQNQFVDGSRWKRVVINIVPGSNPEETLTQEFPALDLKVVETSELRPESSTQAVGR